MTEREPCSECGEVVEVDKHNMALIRMVRDAGDHFLDRDGKDLYGVEWQEGFLLMPDKVLGGPGDWLFWDPVEGMMSVVYADDVKTYKRV